MNENLTLDSTCDFINGGSWSSNSFSEKGCPVVKVSNIKNDTIDNSSLSFLDPILLDKYKKNILRKNDVIIATVGSHPSLINSAAGRSISVSKQHEGFLLNQNAVCIRTKDSSILSQKYLGYLIKENKFKKSIQKLGRGAANQMRIPISSVKKLKLNLPSITTQKKIASILSAYDDLIENNLKRIKLLEEKAQLTYEEWFVRMKYPGHENDEVDSETGLPIGWRMVNINNLYSINYGKNLPVSKIKKNGKYKVYGASGVMGFYEKKNCNSKATLITSRGNGSGEVHRTFEENTFVTNNSFVVKPKDEYIELSLGYTYEFLKDLDLKRFCSGSAQPQLTISALINIEVSLPKKQVLLTYKELSDKIISLVDCLRRKNNLLLNSRDLLLPRLMSGMIDIDEVKYSYPKETLA